MAVTDLLLQHHHEAVLAQAGGVAETVWVIVAQAGPWGLLVIVLGWITWMYATDRIVSNGRFWAEAEEKEFWRDAALMTSEMGELLGKAKASSGAMVGRRASDRTRGSDSTSESDELASQVQLLQREVARLKAPEVVPGGKGDP